MAPVPILLFKLNGVPEDEADEVRELLGANRIAYYETHAGRWGVSVAAIWLRDDSQLDSARRLLDDYQIERFRRARAEYDALGREGRQETLIERFNRAPIRFLIYVGLVAVVLFAMLAPFLIR
jgi:hypothetical protein